jgi:hypothetical protein
MNQARGIGRGEVREAEPCRAAQLAGKQVPFHGLGKPEFKCEATAGPTIAEALRGSQVKKKPVTLLRETGLSDYMLLS